jgi:hypothetical protein
MALTIGAETKGLTLEEIAKKFGDEVADLHLTPREEIEASSEAPSMEYKH